MNQKKLSKILAFSAFIIILGISFVLMMKFHTLSSDAAEDVSAGIAYFLLVVLVLLSLTNLIVVMQLTTETKTKGDYLKKTTVSPHENSAEESVSDSQEQDEGEAKIDIESLEKKILPPTDKKSDVGNFSEKILANLANEFDIVQGLFYVRQKDTDTFTIAGKFAYFGEEEPGDFELGSTLSGQTAKNQKVLNLTKIPENYITILSGLGSSSPNSLLLVPIIQNNKTIGMIELASFQYFEKRMEETFARLSGKIGKRLSETI